MSDVIVVGAGLAGLAAAYEARRLGAGVVVLESEHRPGGVVVTENVEGGWVVEGGPDSFLPGDGTVAAVSDTLGIADRVVRQAAHGAAVWTGQALQPLSEGDAAGLLGIPVKPEDLKVDHLSYARGMTELVEAFAAAIRPSLRLRVGVSGLSATHDGFRLSVTGGSTVSGSTLILALPAWRAAQLLRGIEPHVADALGAIRYAPSLTVSLAYRAEQVGAPLEGTGFVVAASGVGAQHAAPLLRACTYASSKFPGRAPAGHVLVRAFIAESSGSAADEAHRGLRLALSCSSRGNRCGAARMRGRAESRSMRPIIRRWWPTLVADWPG